MMKKWSLIGILLTLSIVNYGQELTDEDIDFINKEIRFVNESIHRMVIVFQVFENYNSEITRHVDLPKNEGIQTTSTHLPGNLFADNSLVKRGDSPLELYRLLSQDKRLQNIPINNWSLIEQVKRVIDVLNEDRQKLDQIIQHEDLDAFSNIQTIYEEIEQAIASFDQVRNTVKILEKLMLQSYFDLPLSPKRRQVFTAVTELHYDIKKIVRQLRNDNQSGVINGLSKLEKEIGWLHTCIEQLDSAAEKNDLRDVVAIMDDLIDLIKDYIDGKPVPEEYIPFGKGYYYHNYGVLPTINQYGSGYVWKLEEFFEKYNWRVINFFEEPHYLKIVYPQRIPLEMMKGNSLPPEMNIREINPPELPKLASLIVEKTETTLPPESSVNEVNKAPKENEIIEQEPPIMIMHSQTIKVDTAFFELLLFDHYSADGDRVSINVNGVWVFNKISLERKSRRLKLSIKPGVANFIIIRADNEGWRTPNTIGVKYKSKRSENNVFIRKDLGTYEAIELKFTL